MLSLQINGIAVDNKSLSDCEALLRSCRDTLSISLMKVSSPAHTGTHKHLRLPLGVFYLWDFKRQKAEILNNTK